MPALEASLRRTLEKVIIDARDAAEEAARQALDHLLLHNQRTGDLAHLDDEARKLRRRLQAKERQLGGREALVRECAYEQWHTMLFARFLEVNGLLMHPEGVSVSLADCAELAADEGEPDAYAVAAKYAALMLPGIFRPQDPLLQVRFAPEHRHALESLLESIPKPTYAADDGLGWVYQFWQARRKEQVNDSGGKISGADISPVTQLFTEHYMVQFMLHNTIGAWWTARHPDQHLPTEKSYLRTLEDGTPAAGTFDGWPATVKELKVIDPCCGSGHFLVAAFTLLRRLRMIEEGLSEAEAAEAVLRDNLHGLELDPRCTQLAAFNLTLEAWKAGGYRSIPIPNVACSGIPVGTDVGDWLVLVDDVNTRNSLRALHDEFRSATDLGSLINPRATVESWGLYGTETLAELANLMGQIGHGEKPNDPTSAIFGEAVQGVAKAARLLSDYYHLVVTNVPYLARGKQGEVLANYLKRRFPAAKADLATAFVDRCFEFCSPKGTVSVLTPQNWWYQNGYRAFREELILKRGWRLLVPLGEEAWTTFGMRGPTTMMGIFTLESPKQDNSFISVDMSSSNSLESIASSVREGQLKIYKQKDQILNPDSRVKLDSSATNELLSKYADSYQGISPADAPKYGRYFWEVGNNEEWVRWQSTPNTGSFHSGYENVLWWSSDLLEAFAGGGAYLRGQAAWGKRGISIRQMRQLDVGFYYGDKFDTNAAIIIPKRTEYLTAIFCYCASSEYASEIRKIDKKVNVTNATLVKVPFDLAYWQQFATERYPDGLPAPYSDDPTQWIFKGTVLDTTEPLQVAMARLLGYSWPEQEEDGIIADVDGIVCLPSVGGGVPAHERLLDALSQGFGLSWKPAKLAQLLLQVGSPDLPTWLCEKFFEQHIKLFHHRPFLWHIWDGRKDGFSAIVNYHGLDRAKLEKLTYTYLGNWINQQQAGVSAKTTGAEARLVAAKELQGKLEAILGGEPPYDVYVRWKPLHEQALGWDPDSNDGVRINIRPFVMAGVLRAKVNVKWTKDRGNDPKPNASGTTERHNDLHLTLEQKRQAREAVKALA
ncbi:Eco57I restriction-modification methylase domain-containing protein [Deinococcus enclensis]|uniref:site-specific DNA-methyltransferase (adenine-specific) n=1 Tax=Deinococcus enclensis TaxID=1049582 RepID=A0ABT9MIU0_9DEIO|nr:DNA methyltransferase [Deinococcus enclensis]MDP9766503.1 hypothetical protein [Deinococcus enclensis]